MLSTGGVSRLPRRPRSASTFDTIPAEVAHVIPPSSTAASGSHPRSSPNANPGNALSTKLTTLACIPVRSPVCNSSCEYCNPRASRSSKTPISAPIEMKSSLTLIFANPPSPTASPAMR